MTRWWLGAIVAAVCAAIVACGDGFLGLGRDPGPRLEILAGREHTDTIYAVPGQGLVAQVHDAAGSLAPGVEVRFEAPAWSNAAVYPVGELISQDLPAGSEAAVETDAHGRAAIRFRLGRIAGPAWLLVVVPAFGLADTVHFTVKPGNAFRVRFTPRDTSATLGSSFTFAGTTVDRAGNPRPDPGTFTSTGSAISVTNAGVVTGRSLGFGYVRVHAPIAGTPTVDSVLVSVVPDAEVVLRKRDSLMLGKLDGSVSRRLAYQGLAASWEANRDRVVFTRNGLHIVDLRGVQTPLPTPGMVGATWPEWSVDRQWIYFSGECCSALSKVGRVRPDGSGLEMLSGPNSAMPSPSPDGRSVAWTEGGLLRVLDLQTRALVTIPGIELAHSPRWSPDGNWIAFVRSAKLWLVRPAGTDIRFVADFPGQPGINWSPDSRWIVADRVLIEASTGFTIPAPPLGPYPAWRR